MNVSVRFYLSGATPTATSQGLLEKRVVMSVTGQGERIICYTGFLIEEAYWNRKEQKFLDHHPDALGLNAWLNALRKTARDVYFSMSIKYGKPDRQEYRAMLKKYRLVPYGDMLRTFLLFMEDNATRWAPSTYLKIKSLFQHLRSFSEQYPVKISLESLDSQTLEAFRNYLAMKNMAVSTVRIYLNMMKWFLNWCHKKEYMINTDYRKFQNRLTGDQRQPAGNAPVYLTREELMQLWHFQPGDKDLERARDIYCLLAFSGLRFAELTSLLKTDVTNDKFTIRGLRSRTIPQNQFTRQICRRYENRFYAGNRFLPGYSVPTINKHLRRLASEAGLNRLIPVNKKSSLASRKLAAIFTISSAYHTFTVNCIRLGISAYVHAAWAGHSTTTHYRTIRRLVGSNDNDDIKKLNVWYEEASS
ncbi:MAG TPA: phage integrase SAM-like domain-containing protein [Bacteroidales bacterium]|nr:phage integrase SAM-like domain-containing protein [Bacteroidales bacterium]